LPTLTKAIIEGDLGLQLCVKSALAYKRLQLVKVDKISGQEYEIYHDRYLAKDSAARTLAKNFLKEPQIGQLLSDVLNRVVK
jgi:hypothetical protein